MSQHRVSAKKGEGKGGWWRVARSAVTQAAAVSPTSPPPKSIFFFSFQRNIFSFLSSLLKREENMSHVTALG